MVNHPSQGSHSGQTGFILNVERFSKQCEQRELKEFFASVFPVENMGHVPQLSCCLGEELSQAEVTRDEALKATRQMDNRFPGPGGIQLRALKMFKCENVDLLIQCETCQ